MLEQRIPEKHAVSFRLPEGESFSVIDPRGSQVADLVAFDASDVSERFSTKYTYKRTGKVRITTGDSLYTTEGEPILEITSDDCGVHDILYGPCNEWLLEDYYDQQSENGCRENLTEALSAEGISKEDIHDTFNVFMHSTVADQTYVDIREPLSNPGDTIELVARKDAIVGVSSCAAEALVNAGQAKPIDVHLPEGIEVEANF